MGNETSKTDMRTKKLLLEYDMLRKAQDARLGAIKIFQHKLTKNLIAQKEFKANNKDEITTYQRRFNQRANLEHPNIASVQ